MSFRNVQEKQNLFNCLACSSRLPRGRQKSVNSWKDDQIADHISGWQRSFFRKFLLALWDGLCDRLLKFIVCVWPAQPSVSVMNVKHEGSKCFRVRLQHKSCIFPSCTKWISKKHSEHFNLKMDYVFIGTGVTSSFLKKTSKSAWRNVSTLRSLPSTWFSALQLKLARIYSKGCFKWI